MCLSALRLTGSYPLYLLLIASAHSEQVTEHAIRWVCYGCDTSEGDALQRSQAKAAGDLLPLTEIRVALGPRIGSPQATPGHGRRRRLGMPAGEGIEVGFFPTALARARVRSSCTRLHSAPGD
jgi:hypothetical protein